MFAILPSHEGWQSARHSSAAETGLKSVTDVCSAPQCSHMMCVNTHFSRRFLATAWPRFCRLAVGKLIAAEWNLFSLAATIDPLAALPGARSSTRKHHQ